MTQCEDCGDETKRRVFCERCGLFICTWCYHHVHHPDLRCKETKDEQQAAS